LTVSQNTLPQAREHLVQALVAGHEGAFDQFATQFAGPVLLLAYRLTGDMETARDIRQVALWRTYRSVARFQGRSQLSTWLYRIVVNLCRDWARSRESNPANRPIHDDATSIHAAQSPRRDPIEHDERSRIIRKAMLTLNDTDREVIALRHMRDMTFREMAGILNRPESTVKTQCARALDRLHTALISHGLIHDQDQPAQTTRSVSMEGSS
jgi:RNA polymerase sigma-70 factor (ECF subfamily)